MILTTTHMSQGQNSSEGIICVFMGIFLKGLLGFIKGVVTLAHMKREGCLTLQEARQVKSIDLRHQEAVPYSDSAVPET